MENEKLPISLKAYFPDLIKIPERIHWSVVPWQWGNGQTTVDLFSCKTSVLQLVRIISASAKIFQLNFKALFSWKIDIFCSDGQNFRTISGEGDPSRTVTRDGRGNDGSPLNRVNPTPTPLSQLAVLAINAFSREKLSHSPAFI